eukprot:SAG25_NODE_1436_length_3023_cov_2.872093_1_plen_241_part_00
MEDATAAAASGLTPEQREVLHTKICVSFAYKDTVRKGRYIGPDKKRPQGVAFLFNQTSNDKGKPDGMKTIFYTKITNFQDLRPQHRPGDKVEIIPGLVVTAAPLAGVTTAVPADIQRASDDLDMMGSSPGGRPTPRFEQVQIPFTLSYRVCANPARSQVEPAATAGAPTADNAPDDPAPEDAYEADVIEAALDQKRRSFRRLVERAVERAADRAVDRAFEAFVASSNGPAPKKAKIEIDN